MNVKIYSCEKISENKTNDGSKVAIIVLVIKFFKNNEKLFKNNASTGTPHILSRVFQQLAQSNYQVHKIPLQILQQTIRLKTLNVVHAFI